MSELFQSGSIILLAITAIMLTRRISNLEKRRGPWLDGK